MEYRYEADEFHRTLEPMVIIHDGLSHEEVFYWYMLNFVAFKIQLEILNSCVLYSVYHIDKF